MKTLKGCLFALVAMGGFIGAIIGVAAWLGTFWHMPTVPYCDGQPMTLGSVCEKTRNGYHVDTVHYQTQLDADQFGYHAEVYGTALGIVVVLIIIGCFVVPLTKGMLSRKTAASTDEPTA